MTLHELYIRIAPGKIAFLKFIIEGYDGLATLTTIDNRNGLIKLMTPAPRMRELWLLLDNLAHSCRQEQKQN